MVVREPYRTAHDRSSRHKNDRSRAPLGVQKLLKWAHHEYQLETPGLDHSQSVMDGGGDPEMHYDARAWVGLTAESMDWRRIACRQDKDGHYVTPVRCAIESMPDYRRRILRAIVPHLFEVVASVQAATQDHDMPPDAALDTAETSLRMLWRRVQDRPLPSPRKPNHLEKSAAQIAAEDAA